MTRNRPRDAFSCQVGADFGADLVDICRVDVLGKHDAGSEVGVDFGSDIVKVGC